MKKETTEQKATAEEMDKANDRFDAAVIMSDTRLPITFEKADGKKEVIVIVSPSDVIKIDGTFYKKVTKNHYREIEKSENSDDQKAR